MTNPIRIAYVDSTGDLYGGAESCLYDIVTNINREQFEPIVVSPFWGNFCDQLCKADIHVIALGKSRFPGFSSKIGKYKLYNPLSFLKYIKQINYLKKRLISVIEMENISLIHGNSFTGNIVSGIVASELDLPLITHLRELGPSGKFSNYIFKMIINNFVIRPSELSIAISNSVRDKFISTNNSILDKLFVLYDPVNIDYFNSYVNSGSRSLGLSNKEDDVFIFGLVGRFRRWKGHITSLQALKILSTKTQKKVLLAFVGDIQDAPKDYIAEIDNTIDKLDLAESIIMVDFQEDIRPIYSALDAVIVPSYTEPLGRVVLEGMAMCKPVIATSSGGPGEIITNRVDGLLVTPRNARNLSDRMLELIDNPLLRERIAIEGRKKVVSEFGVNAHISFLLSLYKKALKL